MDTILNDHDWNDLGRQFRVAKPFPSVCIDNFLKEDFVRRLTASYPNYLSAKEMGREFETVNERLKVQITSPELFPEPVAQLSKMLGSEDFLSKLHLVTGIENLCWDPSFTGGGMHITGPSGILDVHVDFNFEQKLGLYRRLNILIYLNPVWEDSWGGNIELWDKQVKRCEQSKSPILNRCLLFATSDFSFHGVTAVRCPEGITRNSFAAYYYTEQPGDNDGKAWGGNHTTIFKARPDERLKRYWSMPLEKLGRNIRTAKSSLKSMFKGQ